MKSRIDPGWLSSAIMISRLKAISPAPGNTIPALKRQIRSTR
jgi:hypothetical protein